MKVAILSKALIVCAYRSKLEQLAALPDIEVIAIVPPEWRDERGVMRMEDSLDNVYELIVTPIAFNGNFHLHFYPQIDRLLQRIRPDILHIDEEPYNLATVLALRSAQRVKARTLFFSWQNLNRSYPFPFNRLERYVLNHVDACIAGTQDAQTVWRAKGYRGPIEIIPQFGVDQDMFAPAPRSRDGTFVIGYVGRFVLEKGIDILLQALSKLTGSWRADLLGSGPDQTRLIDLAQRLHIENRVRCLPWIPSTRLPDYYHSLDCLVLPSRTQSNWKEQFGRALVEAMGCGVPVIGSNCGEIPNVIADAGLIFPEGNVDALRQLLINLQENPAMRADLSRRGRQRVLDQFTQAEIARKTYGVYQRIKQAA